MGHANRFLQEIGKQERQDYRQSISATRWAQAKKKDLDDYMRHLRQQERLIEIRQAEAEGRIPTQVNTQTEAEKIWLEAREHVRLSDLPAEQQSEFQAERDAMWAQIPAQFQEKAKKLAGH